ncbi:hypothetical protein LXL04_019947 [Taraxacum kok-saghyz]
MFLSEFLWQTWDKGPKGKNIVELYRAHVTKVKLQICSSCEKYPTSVRANFNPGMIFVSGISTPYFERRYNEDSSNVHNGFSYTKPISMLQILSGEAYLRDIGYETDIIGVPVST